MYSSLFLEVALEKKTDRQTHREQEHTNAQADSTNMQSERENEKVKRKDGAGRANNMEYKVHKWVKKGEKERRKKRR